MSFFTHFGITYIIAKVCLKLPIIVLLWGMAEVYTYCLMFFLNSMISISKHMKEILVELMDRFDTSFYNAIHRPLSSSVTQLRYFWRNYVLSNFSLLDSLLRPVSLLMAHSHFILIMDQQNLSIFSGDFV